MEAAKRVTSGEMSVPESVARAGGGAAATAEPPSPSVPMDRDFIAKNQIVEKYLSGRLPPRGVTDFERAIRGNPALIEELGLASRVHAGLRLLEASGAPEPWAEKPRNFFEKPAFVAAAAAAAVIGLLASAVLAIKLSGRDTQIIALKKENFERPISPSGTKRTVIVRPARGGPPKQATLEIASGELVELKTDLSWTNYGTFRVTLDRVDQGRVAIIDNLTKDSNNHMRLSLNGGAFGPGDYLLTIEGLNMRREATPLGWARVAVTR
jgi:hypothetical protein